MNYYKILNKEECHFGLQYKFGLNIDPKEFNPSGDCEPGGIYFSREDILAFLVHGPWIRKVTLPEDARVYENPGKPRKWKTDKVILGKKEKITAKVIKRLIDEGADPKTCGSWALRWAAMRGYLDIVKLLIPVSDPKTNISEALRYAAENGHLEIVKLLIPVSEINESVINYCVGCCRKQEILDLIISNKKEV
ncbi:MAG: ankyrin repeat domain-containing protein [Sphaerochaetaceae bacterium]|nr:ankyrin repeat domain-containing protein [Sphaerochaetaceae bacterium]